MHRAGKIFSNRVVLEVEGGELSVSFTPTEKGFTDVYLTGPADFVFEGTIEA